MGCAEVLGIPSDPELVSPEALTPMAPASDQTPQPGVPLADAGASVGPTPVDVEGSDGIVPPDNVTGLGGIAVPEAPSNGTPDIPPTPEPDGGADAGADAPAGGIDAGGAGGEAATGSGGAGGAGAAGAAGSAGAAGALSPETLCPNDLERAAVDVIMIVDNSASMVTTAAAIEAAMPAFADRLDELLVDYRLILISGHRSAERGTSADNDASLCIAAPLGGVAACPSPAPAPGARFFPYAITIGATSSFARVLAAVDTPDPFGLTTRGWAEWLRPGALPIFVEISDADSDLPAADFVSGLAAAVPQRFGNDIDNPGFVFQAVVGLRQKALELDLYGPDEPVQVEACSGAGSNPANAGETYQRLSRATGGLRQSVCPAGVMDIRLQVLAADIARRSVVACQ